MNGICELFGSGAGDGGGVTGLPEGGGWCAGTVAPVVVGGTFTAVDE